MRYRLVTQHKMVGIARLSHFKHSELKYISLTCPFHTEAGAEKICGEWCPHFELEGTPVGMRLTITCAHTRKLIAIDYPKED